MVASKDDVARDLGRSHADPGSGVLAVYRLVAPKEDDDEEPVKLLEVNENTVERGVEPLFFGPHRTTGGFPLVVVDVTPREFDLILKNQLPLPHGWKLGPKLGG